MDILDGLSMIMENIYSHYGFVEFRIARLRDAVVFMFAVLKCIKA
jgi:hypothetical protein